MADRNKLKKLITTASAATIMLGCIENASAVTYSYSTNYNFNAPFNFKSGDAIKHLANNIIGDTQKTVPDPAGYDIIFIDLNGTSNPTLFRVADDVRLGSVVNAVGKYEFRITDNNQHTNPKTLTLTGTGDVGAGIPLNNYSSMGNILFNDVTAPSTLVVNTSAPITLSGKIESQFKNSKIEVKTAGTTLQGDIGDAINPILELKVSAPAGPSVKFGGNITATDIRLANHIVLTGASKTVNAAINGTAAGVGSIETTGITTFNGNIGSTTKILELSSSANTIVNGNITANNISPNLNNLTVNGTVNSNFLYGGGNATINGTLNGNINFYFAGGILALGNGVTATGNADSSVAKNVGVLRFNGAGTFDGTIGAVNTINEIGFSGAGAVNVGNGKVVNATKLNVQHAGAVATINGPLTVSTINFDADGKLIINNKDLGAVTVTNKAGVTAGTIELNVDQNLTGSIAGAAGFGKFHMNADKIITLNTISTSMAGVNFTTQTDNTATLNMNKAAATVGTVGTAAARYKQVNFNQSSTITNIDATKISVANGVTAAGSILNSGNKGTTLEFAGAGTFNGAVGTINPATEVIFLGAGAVNLGNGNAVKATKLNVQNAGVVGTINGPLTVSTINFDANGQLIINNSSFGATNVTAKAGVNAATIEFGADQTLTGTIAGPAGSGFGKFNMGADKIITLNTTNTDLSGVDFTTTTDNTATLTMAKTGLKVNSVGTAAARYKQVNFNQNSTITNIDATKTTVANGVTATGSILNSGNKGATLEFAGAGVFDGVIGSVNPATEVIFLGAGAVNVGNGKAVNATKLNVQNAGTVATINGPLTTSTINFDANGKLIINNKDLGVASVTAKAGVTAGVIELNVDQNLTGNITGAAGFGRFHMNADKIITLNTASTNMAGVNFTTQTDNTATLNMNKASAVVGNVGTATERYKQVNFNQSSTVTNIDATKTVVANGVTATGSILNSGGKGATLEFAGAGTFNGVIGKTNPVTDIVFLGAGAVNVGNSQAVNATTLNMKNAGAVATINGVLTTKTINFDANGKFIINNNNLGATNVTAGVGVTSGVIELNVDQTLTGNITGAAGFGRFHMNADKIITLNTASTNMIGVNFTTQTDNTATLNMNKVGAVVGTVGTATERYKQINFNQNSTVTSIEATKTVVANGVTAIGTISNSGGKGATLEFAGAGIFDGIIGKINQATDVIFLGAGAVNVGNGKVVNATTLNMKNAGAVATINGPLTTSTINFDANGKLIINNNNLGATNVTAKAGVTSGVIELNVDQTLTGNITGAAGFGRFHMNADKVITLDTANVDLSGVNFTTQTDNTAILNMNKGSKAGGGLKVGTVGTPTERYKQVNFNQNSIINGIDAVNISVANNIIAGGSILNSNDLGTTLTFAGAGTFDGIVGKANPINVVFAGPGAVNLGNGQAVNAYSLNANNAGVVATVNGPLDVLEINFDANGKIIINNNDLGDTDITGSATGAILEVNSDQNLTGKIAGFGSFHMNGDNNISLNPLNNNLSGLNFTTQVDNTAVLNVDKAGLIIGTVGTPTERYKQINYNFDATMVNPIEAHNILVADSVTVTGNIDNSTGGTILEFAGAGVFDGNIGSVNPIDAIIFNGPGSVNVGNGNNVNVSKLIVQDAGVEGIIDGALSTNVIVFDADGHLIINNNDLGATDIGGSATDGKISVNSDQNLTGNITSGLGNFHVDGDKIINLQPANTDLSFVDFTTAVDNTAILNLNTFGLITGAIGTATERFKQVNFLQTATVGDLYAYDVAITDGSVVTFDGDVSVDNGISLNGTNIELHFGDIVLDAPIIANPGGKLFFNDTDIISDLGSPSAPLTEINFISTGVTSNIGGNLYADTINVQSNTIILQDNLTFDGDVNVSDSILNIGAHDLLLENGSTYITNSKICIDANSGNPGQLIAGDGSLLTMTGTVQVDIKNFNTIPSTATEFTLVSHTGTGILDLSTAIIDVTDAGSAFVDWDYEINSDGIKLIADTNIGGTIDDDTGGGLPQDLIDAFDNGGSHPVVVDLGRITSSAVRGEAVNRLVNKTSEETSEVQMATSAEVHDKIMERVQDIDGVDAFLSPSAPASGEANGRYGAWIQPFYSYTVKAKETNLSGYRTNTAGSLIGGDAKVSDELTLGTSFAYVYSDIEYKDIKDGDTTKMNSYMLSVYLNSEMRNDYFAQSMVTVGLSRIDTKETRILSTGATLANAHYDSTLLSVEARIGKNYEIPEHNMIVIPAIGMNYTEAKDDAHKETGSAGIQLLTVGKKTYETLNAVGSVKFTTAPIKYQDYEWKPELMISGRYDLLDNPNMIDRDIPGLGLPIDVNHKPQKLYGTVGTALNVYKDAVEYGVHVTNSFTKHFYNVTGSLNIRVNF